MLTKRIIPCLDVKNGQVVKGVQFRNHQIVGDILELALTYDEGGADELVFYDITASTQNNALCAQWVDKVAKQISIPFCVAGGIRTLKIAEQILHAGADKISINSPALERPELINELVQAFGSQCVVVGVDSCEQDNNYWVYQYTGDEVTRKATQRKTIDWIREVEQRGAGEIVLNCMNQDGMRSGYDIHQLALLQEQITVPIIASGGAGSFQHFVDVFTKTKVSGALAASVFHKGDITVSALKNYLIQKNIEIRP